MVNGGIYIQATRGRSSKSFISYTTCKTCYYGVYKSYDRPYEELEQGVYAITTEDIRWLRCDIKSLNLLGNVLAKEYAVKYNQRLYNTEVILSLRVHLVMFTQLKME